MYKCKLGLVPCHWADVFGLFWFFTTSSSISLVVSLRCRLDLDLDLGF